MNIRKSFTNNFKWSSLKQTKNDVANKMYNNGARTAQKVRIFDAQSEVASKKAGVALVKAKQTLTKFGARPAAIEQLLGTDASQTIDFQDLKMSVPAAIELFNSLLSTGKKNDTVANQFGVKNGDVYGVITQELKQNGDLASGRNAASNTLRIVADEAGKRDPLIGAAVRNLGNSLLTQSYAKKGDVAQAPKVVLYDMDAHNMRMERHERANDIGLTVAQAGSQVKLALSAAKKDVGVSLSQSKALLSKARYQATKGAAAAVGYQTAALRPVGATVGAIGAVGVGTPVVGALLGTVAGLVPVVATTNMVADGLTGGPGLFARVKAFRAGNFKQSLSPATRKQSARPSAIDSQTESFYAAELPLVREELQPGVGIAL